MPSQIPFLAGLKSTFVTLLVPNLLVYGLDMSVHYLSLACHKVTHGTLIVFPFLMHLPYMPAYMTLPFRLVLAIGAQEGCVLWHAATDCLQHIVFYMCIIILVL